MNAPQESEKFSTNPTQNATADILGNVVVWTPEVERLARQMAEWIALDLPGSSVYGPQRNGKTMAQLIVAQMLPDFVGYPVAVFLWSIPAGCARSERAFFQERLKQSGYGATAQRDSAVLRSRLYDYMRQAAERLSTRRVVVMVDEAQNLERVHYGYLIHCYNELERRGLKPFFLLVGQPELRAAISEYRSTEDQQIIGRFFVKNYPYLGIQLDDMSAVLAAFDNPVEDGELSVTERVLPGPHARGWRLMQLAPVICEAVRLLLRQHNIDEELRMPMQYVRSTVLALLHLMRDQKVDPQGINTTHALQALGKAGFTGVLSFYIANGTHAIDKPTPKEKPSKNRGAK